MFLNVPYIHKMQKAYPALNLSVHSRFDDTLGALLIGESFLLILRKLSLKPDSTSRNYSGNNVRFYWSVIGNVVLIVC